jgi:hypothetical protein
MNGIMLNLDFISRNHSRLLFKHRQALDLDSLVWMISILKNPNSVPFYQPTAATAGKLPLPQITTTTRNPLSAPAPSVYDCNFENDFCNWINDLTLKLKWIRNCGTTVTVNTGPTADHT